VSAVLVLGSQGMLGSMLVAVLGANPKLEVSHTARRPDEGGALPFDAAHDSVEELLGGGDWQWVINAIGVTRPHIDETDPESVEAALEVNGRFPHRLAAAAGPGQRIVAISTDGVFSGAGGPYGEAAEPDAPDVYGRSKREGEISGPGVVQLRCSIIGPEPHGSASLLEWALSQPRGERIRGFTNQRWNGLTTLHFAKLCEGMIGAEIGELPAPLHVVPDDSVSKAELLRLALDAFGREDVEVLPAEADEEADRTLVTRHRDANRLLWSAAGYSQPPRIQTMIEELAAAAPKRR
jgi:dTDP-4-dehydrorhamnose reductase